MDNRTNHEEFPTQSEGYGLEIVRMRIVRMFLRESNLGVVRCSHCKIYISIEWPQ